ncbi:hypothetical protein JD844_019632 [Phrynosoma platyrhinos]|uniref:Phosphatidylinositol transfer protein N-terminal domain-containing protein n=1 Tax=Phrynosoma platyrhinos TaxID=52577 RepID=A0ABQ7TQU8_PHRPL|nr:hypothetical protein JD844_019632 [Phrynosoma platyrhinos]
MFPLGGIQKMFLASFSSIPAAIQLPSSFPINSRSTSPERPLESIDPVKSTLASHANVCPLASSKAWLLLEVAKRKEEDTALSVPHSLLQLMLSKVGTYWRCSFLPKFSIYIETKYEDNCGDSSNIFHSEEILGDHEVTFLDIAFDEIPERYYRSIEDLRHFSSVKTGRGPLREGWREHTKPIMCSYKLVTVKFEVWGLQTRVEQFVHKVIRDILLIGHRQAFAWVDEWCVLASPFGHWKDKIPSFPVFIQAEFHPPALSRLCVLNGALRVTDMSLEEVRAFETQMHVATNKNFSGQEP